MGGWICVTTTVCLLRVRWPSCPRLQSTSRRAGPEVCTVPVCEQDEKMGMRGVLSGGQLICANQVYTPSCPEPGLLGYHCGGSVPNFWLLAGVRQSSSSPQAGEDIDIPAAIIHGVPLACRATMSRPIQDPISLYSSRPWLRLPLGMVWPPGRDE